MHQASSMSGGQTLARLPKNAEHFAPGTRLLFQPCPKRPSVDELHRDEDVIFESPDVINRNDVRVRQARHRLGFAQQPRAQIARISNAWMEQLDGDLSIELGIVRGVDHSHPALAERLDGQKAADAGPSHAGSRFGSYLDSKALARANTSSNIAPVSLPVCVFCRLT